MELFSQMESIVRDSVKAYSEDCHISDVAKLKREGKIGTTFYWLVYDEGTVLEREEELLVQSKTWNRFNLFAEKLNKKNCRLFQIVITPDISNIGKLQGKVKELEGPDGFVDFLDKFCVALSPKLYTIHFNGKDYVRKWYKAEDVKLTSILGYLSSLNILLDNESISELYLTFSF